MSTAKRKRDQSRIIPRMRPTDGTTQDPLVRNCDSLRIGMSDVAVAMMFLKRSLLRLQRRSTKILQSDHLYNFVLVNCRLATWDAQLQRNLSAGQRSPPGASLVQHGVPQRLYEEGQLNKALDVLFPMDQQGFGLQDKALADKKQRDLDMKFEQAEKQRAGEVLDTEIRWWAAGKEENLRALLSTLQYILWPQCGWQPISLTDIISAIAVKKAYRKHYSGQERAFWEEQE